MLNVTLPLCVWLKEMKISGVNFNIAKIMFRKIICKSGTFNSLVLVAVLFMAVRCNHTHEQKITGDGSSAGDVPGQQLKGRELSTLQQEFLDLRFGMFIHFNIATFANEDRPDPELSPEVFNPVKLDCNQWADVAVSANMTYGCLTAKHSTGFCLWNTQTTDYSVMNIPFKRDVVKEYADAFRKKGLKVCFYYSILDLRHNIRRGWTEKEHTAFIKNQLTELLTNYGEITCLVFDSWDTGWSRLTYEEIPFEEIYLHVKSLQPNCLISEHNAGKYPSQALFYADIKQYEQNANQFISRETNQVPAQSGLPINKTWFWKEYSPVETLKDVNFLVEENLIPLNAAFCNFILNVAPNRDGLIDDNAVIALKEIGKKWQHPGPAPELPQISRPIINSNLAKHQKINSSWSRDSKIMDLGNDDRFGTNWRSHKSVEQPFFEVIFDNPIDFNMVCIAEPIAQKEWYRETTRIREYELQYWDGTQWQVIEINYSAEAVKIHRFETVSSDKVRIKINNCDPEPAISEFMVYNERRLNDE